MSGDPDWPMWLPSDIHADEAAEEGQHAMRALSTMLWLHSDEFWRRLEAERHGTAPVILLTTREATRAADEFVRRWGYTDARSFVRFAQVLLKGGSEEHPCGSVAASLQHRFGRRGLAAFAGFLAVHYTADEQWRRRCS